MHPWVQWCSDGRLELIAKWPQWGASSATIGDGVRVWSAIVWLNNSPVCKSANHLGEMYGHCGWCNPNIGFMIKCGMQGPMRPRKCVQGSNTLSQMRESAREAQWLSSALPFWELHSCESYECLKPWLERQTSTKLGPQDTIKKILKRRCLKALALFIWTQFAWVMIKRRGGNQIGKFDFRHKPFES
jgi:hypothetical protein